MSSMRVGLFGVKSVMSDVRVRAAMCGCRDVRPCSTFSFHSLYRATVCPFLDGCEDANGKVQLALVTYATALELN